MTKGKELILVGIGCSLGAIVRNLGIETIGAWSQPMAIWVVNMLGCFLIGLLTQLATQRIKQSWFLPFLSTGFCGGLTTFSEFAENTRQVWLTSNSLLALGYIVLTMVIGLITYQLGVKAVKS
ncbi:fluoride efflux transporter FluC [Limosilactobacillus equigenerosi]|uniref:Fluoride-specific ion channel FluC n=1 Tax=Limosilactobacillus equigenerosi DSM 18793 = JCM 14505 TaxID=1423742 RepID=A0A0R1UI25_9LACO|nr:CrcB family protein [Limosilactobacillus equigenerosi]KRL93024.1 hypothetical protein FC21_GL000125 [Limosilactobacillus equigenerosi DSM 18793 = JCM 14505]